VPPVREQKNHPAALSFNPSIIGLEMAASRVGSSFAACQ